jgi:XRE family transcriptional regulator, master regulator for biofilm formation
MNYGKGLKIARALAGLQQKELAKLADIDPSHVSLMEMGKREPSVKTLQKLSDALKIPHHLLVLLSAEPRDLRIDDPEELKRAVESLTHLILGNGQRKSRPRSRRATSR